MQTFKVAVDTDFDPHPQYRYAHDIQDALTGDSKTTPEQPTKVSTVHALETVSKCRCRSQVVPRIVDQSIKYSQ
uniref:Uncharacterized protein n=1 Tax=Timema douglasi TaxID=61478 RepID=A0A7R8Z941_TIMDO|nr:unnamed protein product [Timema douglasi]